MRRRPDFDPSDCGRRMIVRHGLRASAVAAEYVAEAQASGDAAALHRARDIQSAIAEFRAQASRRRAVGSEPHYAD